ncbi:MAG: Fic family protein [Aestuariivita sp.]|nr:Fic family protein [Aestuariivita sp.]MCY4347785.1 Fic family protein [Aestuariivita sp.]
MKIEEYQAGVHEDRYGYQAFVPTAICHEWIVTDPQLINLLGEADRAIGELNAFAQLIPEIDFFIAMYVAKEATQSSRIEGTQTNIEDAFKDADDLNPEEVDDWAEVQNYIRAINFAIDALGKLPLSNRLLRNTHYILMEGVRGETKKPGEFRVSQNWIGVSLRDAVFVPPHHERIPDLMSDLEKLLHNTDVHVHPLIRIAIAHYQFETIHPFLDGNGRLGRLMISLFLASEQLMQKPALYLSDYFERNKTAYVDHLMAVRQGNHLDQWLVFFTHGIVETARASATAFKEILSLKAQIEAEVLPRFSSRRQDNVQQLMRNLYARPIADVRQVKEWIGSTTNTASSLINDLVEYGVLTEITQQRRNRLFMFHRYVGLFRR